MKGGMKSKLAQSYPRPNRFWRTVSLVNTENPQRSHVLQFVSILLPEREEQTFLLNNWRRFLEVGTSKRNGTKEH